MWGISAFFWKLGTKDRISSGRRYLQNSLIDGEPSSIYNSVIIHPIYLQAPLSQSSGFMRRRSIDMIDLELRLL